MSIGIVIVDDSDYMRQRLKSALNEEEFHIVGEAPNGAIATELYKQYDEHIDLVLMDIVMKKANGVQACKAIKDDIDPEANVIMCTSVSQKKKMLLAKRAGADGYVTKPFSESDIRRAIEDVLDISLQAPTTQ